MSALPGLISARITFPIEMNASSSNSFHHSVYSSVYPHKRLAKAQSSAQCQDFEIEKKKEHQLVVKSPLQTVSRCFLAKLGETVMYVRSSKAEDDGGKRKSRGGDSKGPLREGAESWRKGEVVLMCI